MKQIRKRLFSALIAFAVVLSLVPAAAMAVDVKKFTDVSTDSWYYDYVAYVAEKEYYLGTSDTTFAPEATMTRAMFVTALSRVAGETGDATVSPFADVPANTWYTAAVDWATDKGVVNGIGGNKFNPEGKITREDMCAAMARFISYLETTEKKTFKKTADPIDFPDADQISSYAKDAVKNCVAYGLINGTGDGSFKPKANASRAEVAAMIYRLSLMTTTPTGGGGGGGGGPVGPTATSYTITYKDGDTELTTRETEKTTDDKKAFTTLGADDIAEKDGYVLAGWKDEDGRAYGLDASYTAAGDMTLFAQWLDSTDYIAQAVKDTMDQINAQYVDTGKTDVSYANSSAKLDRLVFSNEIKNGARPQTVSGSAEISEDLVVTVIEKAASFACTILTDGKPAEGEIEAAVDDIVDQIEAEFDITISDQTLQQIKDQVYDKVIGMVKPLWANFKDENGVYYTGDVTVSAGSEYVTIKVDGLTTLVGSRREAVKKIGVALAKDMYADLKQYGTYTNKVELEGTVTFTFTPSAAYPNKGGFPMQYPVTLKVVLDGGELVDYKFNSQSYVKLNVTEDVQDTYAEELDKVIKASLSSDAVKDELEPRINATVDKFMDNAMFKDLTSTMVTIGMSASEDAAQKYVKAAMSSWQNANMNLDDLANSPLFKIYWEQDPNAAYVNDAVHKLIDDVAKKAGEFVSQSVKDKVGNTAWKMLGKSVTPEDLLNVMLENNVDIGFADIDNVAIRDYVLAAASDQWREDVGDSSTDYTGEAAPAMKAEADKLVKDALEDTSYYSYLEKALKLKKIEDMEDLQLSNLSTLLRKDGVGDVLVGRGGNLLNRLAKLIAKLPAGASVTIDGVKLDKAALEDIRTAADAKQAALALADLIDSGLQDLSISSFAPAEGQEITVQYNARTFSFHLVVDVK